MVHDGERPAVRCPNGKRPEPMLFSISGVRIHRFPLKLDGIGLVFHVRKVRDVAKTREVAVIRGPDELGPSELLQLIAGLRIKDEIYFGGGIDRTSAEQPRIVYPSP